jgi:predicted dehydrogenase
VDRLRVGTLGAARITPAALIKPAREVPEVTVAAVAARDPARAREFASRHGIAVVHDSYAALIADPDIDAIYNPLPNSLHAPWTLRAIAAGKHVLCEKPFTSNEAEAIEVADAARSAGLVVMEAFHYRYHPMARRMLEVVTGELGELRHVEAHLCFPLPRFSDIRYQFDLAGGATMDAGCYPINCIRLLGQHQPAVVSARAKLHGPAVDRAMVANFRFPGGATGRISTSLWSGQLLRLGARAVRRARRDARLQLPLAAGLQPAHRPGRRKDTARARPRSGHVHLPAAGVRGRGPPGRAGDHHARGRGGEHAGDRRRVPRRRPAAPRHRPQMTPTDPGPVRQARLGPHIHGLARARAVALPGLAGHRGQRGC